MKQLSIVRTVLLLATGCGTSSPTEIATTTLAGKVAGQAWTFQAGHTSAFLSKGEPDFFASLYPMTFTACGFSEPTGGHVIAAIPKMTGDYDLDLSLNMTFTDGSNNLIATEGRIVVDSVTATHVTGGLHAIYDSANEVDGQFDVTICPDTP
jgi:hypothetical protein